MTFHSGLFFLQGVEVSSPDISGRVRQFCFWRCWRIWVSSLRFPRRSCFVSGGMNSWELSRTCRECWLQWNMVRCQQQAAGESLHVSRYLCPHPRLLYWLVHSSRCGRDFQGTLGEDIGVLSIQYMSSFDFQGFWFLRLSGWCIFCGTNTRRFCIKWTIVSWLIASSTRPCVHHVISYRKLFIKFITTFKLCLSLDRLLEQGAVMLWSAS